MTPFKGLTETETIVFKYLRRRKKWATASEIARGVRGLNTQASWATPFLRKLKSKGYAKLNIKGEYAAVSRTPVPLKYVQKLGDICTLCAELSGARMVEGHTCTVNSGVCPHCDCEMTLVPWVDFNWPGVRTAHLRD